MSDLCPSYLNSFVLYLAVDGCCCSSYRRLIRSDHSTADDVLPDCCGRRLLCSTTRGKCRLRCGRARGKNCHRLDDEASVVHVVSSVAGVRSSWTFHYDHMQSEDQ